MNLNFYRFSAFVLVVMNLFLLYKYKENRHELVVRASIFSRSLLKNKKILIPLSIASLILVLVVGLLTYISIDNIITTEAFRSEFNIGLKELINLKSIEKILINATAEEKEWGNFMIGKLREARFLLLYNILIISYVILLSNTWKASIEIAGIRFNGELRYWNEFKGYFWNKNKEIVFIDKKGFVAYTLRVSKEDRNKLDDFLKSYLVKRK